VTPQDLRGDVLPARTQATGTELAHREQTRGRKAVGVGRHSVPLAFGVIELDEYAAIS